MLANKIITILTPSQISEDQKNSLIDVLTEKLGKDFEFEFLEDSSLLGGLVVQVGSKKLDLSIKGKLNSIEEFLNKNDS